MSETNQSTGRPGSPMRVGILHSLSGTMAISEASLKDAELMAIAEINQAGGVLGRRIEPVIEDGASDPATFALKARKLVEYDKVTTIFGGWTSASRKAVLPILEELNALMWYPVEYEGLECSRQIFYMGICPNQQVGPAVDWLLQNKGKQFYLLGSDYVFPRTANKLIKAQLKRQGGSLMGEEYVPLGTMEFHSPIDRIKQVRPDVVFSTLNGDSNLAFYQQYKEAGLTAEDIPILAVSVAEEELRRIGGSIAVGHYASWSYFQSIDTPTNQAFVRSFQERYGQERVTSDPIEAAYVQVYLWKLAAEKAGSFEVELLREAAYGQKFEAPGGQVSIEPNNHLKKHCRIGKILPNGQFEIVFTSASLIKPQPWLGLEEFSDRVSPVVIDMLAEVSQSIQYSCQLEQKSREVEAAMTQLLATNEQLQKTQDQLLHSEAKFRELQAQEKLLKRRLSSQIRSSLEFDEIVKTAVEEIRSLLHIDRCQFFWCHPDSNLPQLELIHEAQELGRWVGVPGASSVEQLPELKELVAEPSILRIDDTATDCQLETSSRDRFATSGIKSILIAPLQTRNNRIGLVVCEHYQDSRLWSDREVELIAAVVEQLANAIDQAELYAHSRNTAALATSQAEQLQKALQDLQLYQAQLVQTEKMSTLGTLVAGVAHEINNPTSFIYGNLHYAKEYTENLLELVRLYQNYYPEPAPEIQARIQAVELDFLMQDLPKTLSSMEIGAERIRHLVLSLRNFSRLDQSSMQAVDIHEGIDSTLLILRNRLKGNGRRPNIELIKEYGKLPLVECHPSQLNQVFMNLLGNAIDALEEPIIAVKEKIPQIWIRSEATVGDRVMVRIGDNGPGMTEEVKEKLFDPFFTTKPIGKGTGLGLSISYQIVVEKHGGALWCNSALGEGTEFAIELPTQHSNKRVDTSTSIAATSSYLA
ncbi:MULTISPECIES: urea ABC transporter substrate-binding protein [unclassified Coleofasciculus]|uniref:urea ABC transporter substrate-binding protein n=1 Tax=unclassified Coleofasciculus TaxID=2692782 RepID=UPI0018819F4B|nr:MULTISPECIES: urea ABC transporter substrate-binding protein [unclassified Coleofasciculus]MBE9127230.1 urea ABC transporter substrate-binding protein [Coleofasciculus sp. LEGE 07081]MBE9150522.1 urea ABC transporter substrate-binding protein [Coleofasciculus sp. LEGE 07092]